MHPVAFNLGGLTVHWYGVLVACGFLAGFWTAGRRAPRTGVAPETVYDLGPWLILGAIAGARMLYVISYWRTDFADKPWWEVFMIHHGGLVYYGGLIGAALGTIGFARWKRLPLWRLADVLAPSIALGQAFGRLGCLMNGCCYGKPATLPWAIEYPADHATHGIAVHPTQVYESLLSAGLYVALAQLYRHRRFEGQVFAVYLLAYAILRTAVELFRGDYGMRYLGGCVTPGQLVSAGILAAGGLLWWWQGPGSKAGGPKSEARS